MNATEGLKRIAKLVRWIASGVAVLIFGGGLVIATIINLAADRLLIVIASAVTAAIVYGMGKGLGWVIDGFAESQESKE
jgi:antitoxin (DNA-binding transcriptional repressor) of toxin-antitoxin stability system